MSLLCCAAKRLQFVTHFSQQMILIGVLCWSWFIFTIIIFSLFLFLGPPDHSKRERPKNFNK